MFMFNIFGKKSIKELKAGKCYICDNMVFKPLVDVHYDGKDGASIPYYWLVDLKYEKCHTNSTLGLPKKCQIFYATDKDIKKAEEIYNDRQVTFDNVERLILESKRKLDEALRMLNHLKRRVECNSQMPTERYVPISNYLK